MMMLHLSYTAVSTGEMACSASWISENEKATADHSYFRTMIGDTVRGLEKREIVYVFTQEQLGLVLHRCAKKGMEVAHKMVEGCYRIERL